MKTLLVGINAKFIHSNPAVRCLKKYAESKGETDIAIAEFTINQYIDYILSEIYKRSPEVIGFSCYIWNYELIKSLTFELKKILPELKIFLGGPEVSFNPKDVLSETDADVVISGEGEEIFFELISALKKGESISDIKGISYKEENGIITNGEASTINLDEVPFIYDDMEDFKDRIVYYESSRGCPFRCQYCLSGGGNRVRLRSLDKVLKELQFFIDKNVRQVKFVDRTFNCDKDRAMAIWRYISEHDNGITNFHFEIAAELIDEDMSLFLNTVRQGLFQFEIGVQSTNKETLKAVKRVTLPDKLTPVIQSIQRGKNIHLHLDLIAGLPFEGYSSFKESFNYVASLSPDQLQLGFLKLLKGSGLYNSQKEYGLVHTSFAPYEILKTDCLSYAELQKLKMVEQMVETYYNSRRYIKELELLLSLFPAPFDMFEALSVFYEEKGYHNAPHGKLQYYLILEEFAKENGADTERFRLLALFDIYSHEKAKKLPPETDLSFREQYKNRIFDFYDNPENVRKYLPQYKGFDTKQLIRSAHIEVFPFNPITGDEKETAILFNYKKCDILGNAEVREITLQQKTTV